MENTASQRVLALVLRSLGDAEFNPVSDRALSRCLGISHTQAALIRKGEYSLNYRAFMKAMRYLDLPADEFMELRAQYDAEVSGEAGTLEWIVGKIRDSDSAKVASKFFKVPVILLGALGMMAHVDDAAASGNLVFSAHPAPEVASEQCILCQIVSGLFGRAKQLIRDLLNPAPLLAYWFPVCELAHAN